MPTYKKYFQNKFLLNGVELESVSIGASAIGKFEEPLDEYGLHLPFTLRDYEYPMRGLLQTYSEDYAGNRIENAYLILNDEVEEGSKYGEWKHNLRVMEYSGKYDIYLYHTFTYTKPIKNNNPAPFMFMNTLNQNTTNELRRQIVFKAYFLEPIDIKTQYYTDETITIGQVARGIQGNQMVSETLSRYQEVDVFLRVDNGARRIVSNAPYSFTLSEGNHTIDYGFLSTTGDEVVDKRFYVTSISRSGLSLLDAINIIRDSKPFESKLYHTSTRLFNIDPAIESYLASIEMPQMFLQKATMRQILNTMFSYVNAISRFYYNTEDVDTLSMDEFNKVIGSFGIEDVVAFTTSQEALGLFNQGIVWGERVLPSSFEEETSTSPAENLYKTVRSTTVQLTDSKFGIPLEAELYQPIKLTTKIDQIKITAFASGDEQITNNFILDLTPRFINREEWLLKEYSVNFPEPFVNGVYGSSVGLRQYKVSNLSWQQGQKMINLSEVNGEVVQRNVVFTTIQEALNEYITRVDFEPSYYDYFGETVLVTGYQIDYDMPDTTEYKDLQFQLKYITFESFPFQTHRENITNSPYYSEGRINQSDKAMNISFASMRAHGDTQRSGVPSIQFVKIYDDYSNVLRWGMKDANDYIIVEEKFEFHNEFMKASYTATKDHNRLSLWTNVDQEYRWQEIPQSNQVFERQEVFNENIVITNPNITLIPQTTFIQDGALDLIFGTLMNDWKDGVTEGKTKVTTGYIRTDGFIEIYPNDSNYKYLILTPVRSFGGKHGFSFVFGFEGNQVAGNAIEKTNITGPDTYWNKAIRYTDSNGEFTTMWVSLATEFLISPFHIDGYSEEQRLQNYPLTRLFNQDDFYVNSSVTHKSGDMNFNSSSYNGLMFGRKDKSQSIKVAIQNSVFPKDYKEYVLGISFFTNNFIVNNPEVEFGTVIGTPMWLYRYIDGTQYDKFSIYKIKPNYATPVLLESGVNVTYENGQFRFDESISFLNVTSWAIGDGFGNLYLACNFPYNGFNVSRQHFYTDQQVIGSEKYSDGSVSVNLLSSIVISDVFQVNQFVFPVYNFDDSLSISSILSSYRSTDYVVDMSSSIVMSDSLAIVKSQDFVFEFNDLLTLSSTVSAIQSTNYLFDLDSEFTVSDTISVGSFIFPRTSFNDLILFEDDWNVIKSTDFELVMLSSFTVTDTIELVKSTNYVVSFSDTAPLTSSMTGGVSTDYTVTLSTGLTVSDTITVNKSTDYIISDFTDTLSISSTISAIRPATNWVYIGTSGTQNQNVTYIAEGSLCATSSVIDAWLESSYPASNYDYGYVMRVTRGNEDLVPCSPLYYFYFATS